MKKKKNVIYFPQNIHGGQIMKKEILKLAVNSLLAGIFIGMAGTVYLSSSNPVTGAFLFGFGLLTIVCYGFKLYTGAIGYLMVQGKDFFKYLFDLLIIWLGNLAGCFLVGKAISLSRVSDKVVPKAARLCDIKMADSPASLFILAVFCGILMFLAVESFRRKEQLHAIVRTVLLFLCVAIFILSGFEHCIANMYYFSVAGKWSTAAMLNILLMTAGNSAGGFLLPLLADVKKP